MLGVVDWILAAVAIIGGLYLYGTWEHNYFKKRNFPTIPSPLPFFGNMGPMASGRLSFGDMVNKIYNDAKGYKIVGFFDFNNHMLMARDPEVIKMVMVKDFDYFVDRITFFNKDVDPLFMKSLLFVEGQQWKNMRATLSPAFTSSKMKAMFGLVSESGKQLADHLEKRCKDEKNKQLDLDMKDIFTRYANDVIATSAFGIQCNSLDEPKNEFYVTGKESVIFHTKQTLKFIGYRVSAKLMRLLGVQFLSKKADRFFTSLVVDTMKTREKEGIIRPDMIHLLMEAKKGTLSHEGADEVDNQSESHKPGKTVELDDVDLAAQAFLFFLAGFDTSSTNLSFLSHLLVTHPDVQRRVQEEIDAILEADGGKLTYDGLQKAKYLDMCVSEALRLWPPTLFTSRQCVKPYLLAATDKTPSLKMNVGDGIFIPIMGIQRDPQYFPDPDRFDPERFSDENKHKIQPFTYMPFGTGPRNCIGMRFGQMEVKAGMMHLLSRFNLQVSPKTPKKLIFTKHMSVNVEGGFWLRIVPRK